MSLCQKVCFDNSEPNMKTDGKVGKDEFFFQDDDFDKAAKPKIPPKVEKKSDWSFEEDEMEDRTQKKQPPNLRKKDTEEIIPMDEEIIDEEDEPFGGNRGGGKRYSTGAPFEEEIIDDEVDDKPTKPIKRLSSRESEIRTDPKQFKRLDTKSMIILL